MLIDADVEVPASEFILGRVLQEVGEYRAELTQFVPLRDQFIPYFWIEHDDPSRVEPVLQDHPQIEAVTKYDERAGWTLYQLGWAGPLDDFLAILLQQDVLVSQASGTAESWSFELLSSSQDEIAAFQDACTENGIPLEINRVSSTGPSSVDSVGLTEKQREVLQLAHAEGYFAVPRQVTTTELGEALDISPQAASKRLRRGMESVVDHVFADA